MIKLLTIPPSLLRQIPKILILLLIMLIATSIDQFNNGSKCSAAGFGGLSVKEPAIERLNSELESCAAHFIAAGVKAFNGYLSSQTLTSYQPHAAGENSQAGGLAYKNPPPVEQTYPNMDKDEAGKEKNGPDAPKRSASLRNDAKDAPAAAGGAVNGGAPSAEIPPAGYLARETYLSLLEELANVAKKSGERDPKIKVDGEIRYHYASNSGEEKWKDSSGIRTYLGFEAEIKENWRAFGMLEGRKSLLNYDNELKISDYYVLGKIGGRSTLQAGSFGYLMAEGNIYDSGFKGVRTNFGGPVKYTLSYGETDYTKNTYVATARYADFDYNLEAGVYRYRLNEEGQNNTIRTLSGKYNFSNFSIGAMYLGSGLKDRDGNSEGCVLTLSYGDLRSWKRGAYEIFTKYYNQPRYTYIAHGMDGLGSWMDGFRGFGIGAGYTVRQNLVASIGYYDLEDKISKEKGRTLWSQMTYYF